jgi:hypothetical protein
LLVEAVAEGGPIAESGKDGSPGSIAVSASVNLLANGS